MAIVSRPNPPALPHGHLDEIFPNVFFLRGTIKLAPAMCFGRNMTVVREGRRLVVINSVRLDEAGLAKLDALGRVTDVIRLAGFHGMDDNFYRERYSARVWAIKGQRYTTGFKIDAENVYLEPDELLTAASSLPLEGARLHVFDSTPTEAMILLERDRGIAIVGDSLQHWERPDAQTTFLASLFMRASGFYKPYNVGPGWLKQAKPSASSLRGVLDLEFDHVATSHGEPVIGGAREKYRPAIERAAEFASEREPPLERHGEPTTAPRS